MISGFLLIKLVMNSISFQKLLHNKKELDNRIIDKLKTNYQINRNIKVYEANIDVPFTIGFIKPKIYLPKNSDFEKLEFILAHELAHIKRGDFLMIMIQNIITIAFFFHPVVLIASGFLNYYRELVCDDMAVEAIHSSPKKYGRKIIDYLEFCIKQKRYPILANGFLFSKKIFVKRIEYLVNRKDEMEHKLSKFQVFLVVVLIGVMILLIACETVIGPNKIAGPEESVRSSETLDTRDHSRVKFIPYDEAPEPIGGFAAIQKNVVYPQIAQEAGIEGTVVVQCFINKTGDVTETEILKGVSKTGLNEAAIAAVSNAKFKPAKNKDGDVGVWISIPIVFKLNNQDDTAERTQPQAPVLNTDLESQSVIAAREKEIGKIQADKPKPRFIPYDQAPEPIGGFAVIQKRVVYPEIAHSSGIEGTVVVQAFVNENGDVSETSILKGIPKSGLDEAAIDAIQQTKFRPAKQKDKTVGVWISIPVVFKMKD
jgi:TonB family protein